MSNETKNFQFTYFRSIGRMQKENNRELIVGYVSIKKSRLLYDERIQQEYFKKVEVIHFSILEDLYKVHPLLRQLPRGDVRYELTETIYEKLKELAEVDELPIWLYLSTVTSNS